MKDDKEVRKKVQKKMGNEEYRRRICGMKETDRK